MRVEEAGRFVHPAHAVAPRRYLERHLLSLHGRGARLRAIAGAPHAPSHERDVEQLEALTAARTLSVAKDAEWLLLRDYDGNGRERSVVFFFRGGDRPHAIVKVRARDAEGASLQTEADALRAIAPLLDASLRATVPSVEEFVTTDGHELLVMSALPGCSLSILMQRSLRPRTTHVPHLLAAARWLGAFHRQTNAMHGDFWPRNVLFETGSEVAGVVDWEHARIGGSRWDDVFLLPLLYATDAPSWRRRDRLSDFRSAFSGDGPLATAIDAYFRAYGEAAGVEQRAIADALAEYLRARDAELFAIYTGVR